jgi:hypothetical protein
MASSANHWIETYDRVQRVVLAEAGVINARVYPRWIGDNAFWYERRGIDQTEYCVIDAVTGAKRIAFTQADAAAALASALNVVIDPETLILKNLRIAPDLDCASFSAHGSAWQYQPQAGRVIQVPQSADRDWLGSPDGKLAAFVRGANLWVRDRSTLTRRFRLRHAPPWRRSAPARKPAGRRIQDAS